MFQQLRTLFGQTFNPKRDWFRLVVTDDGVALIDDERELWRFCWDEVTRIESYKRDLGIVDRICVDFAVEPGQWKCPTHDEMHGFDILCGRLNKQVRSIAEDWWCRVAFPAFETNFSVIYEKQPA